jgi:hypothetical protein
MTIQVGDKIKVIGQDITGYVIETHGSRVVIEDDTAEIDDNRLEFKLSEVEELNERKDNYERINS